jgi:cytochrome c
MLSQIEANQIIQYILDVSSPEDLNPQLQVKGQFQLTAKERKSRGGRLSSFFSTPFEMGSYVFLASYTDLGSEEVPGLNLTGNDFVLLKYPLLAPESADIFSAQGISFTPSTNDPGFIFTGKGGHIGFRNIDLTGISLIHIGVITRFWHWSHFIGASVELRLGSPDGQLLGESYRVPPAPKGEKGPFFGEAAGKPVPVDVSKINGVHDLFIVIKNAEAEESDALVIMTGIEFKQ